MANNNNFISSFSFSSSSSSSSLGQYQCNNDSEWVDRVVRRVKTKPFPVNSSEEIFPKPIPVDGSEEIFPKPISIDIREEIGSPGPCIFKVPKSLSDLKPEAYFPQEIGLGPYHHFRRDLYYRTERKKFDVVKRLLSPTKQELDSRHHLILQLTEHDVVIRVFYEDCCSDLKGEMLAWLSVIDAFFLLDHLSNYLDESDPAKKCKKDKIRDHWPRDIIMEENQIPLVLLCEVHKSVQSVPPSFDHLEREFEEAVWGQIPSETTDELYKMMLTFCEQHSPFNLAMIDPLKRCSNSYHLLDFMYNLILYYNPSRPERASMSRGRGSTIGIRGSAAGTTLLFAGQVIYTLVWMEFIASIPWKIILNLSRKVSKSDNNKGKDVKKINIPTVSELCDIGGVEFDLYVDDKEHEGYLQDIYFNKKDRTFCLPRITLNSDDSEVILRNLVAHEKLLHKKERPPILIGDYVDLMSAIIKTPDDVLLLQASKIIRGSLDSDKIVELFDGISKSTGNTDLESHIIKDVINDVNKHFDNRLRVKAFRYTKTCLYTSWKLAVFIASVITTLQVIQTAFCGIFYCDNIFHHKEVASTISPADLGLKMFPAI